MARVLSLALHALNAIPSIHIAAAVFIVFTQTARQRSNIIIFLKNKIKLIKKRQQKQTQSTPTKP